MSFAGLTKEDNKLFKKQVRSSAPALLQQIDVVSNENKNSTVSLITGTVRVLYYESILQDTVRASVVFSDAGNTMTRTVKTGGQGNNNSRTRKDKKKISAVEGLPIVGEEQVSLKFTDNNDNTIKFGNDNSLYINSITPIPTDSQTTGKAYELDLVSKGFIDNEKERVRYCSADQISEQVKKIFNEVLKTENKLDIEDTKNPIQYIGKNRKPFYVLNDLSKKAVSSGSQELGFSAGYFFYETSEGYKFKSIDTLLSGVKKKSIIYNETPDTAGKGIPPEYDIKALTLDTDNRVNVQKKLAQGAYNIRSIAINPFNTNYEVKTIDAFDPKVQEKLKLAGKGLPTQNEVFTKNGADANFSRTTYYLTTVGQKHIGDPDTDQIQKAEDENFEKNEVVNQSIMRYNQLFASQITITIPGEFSLHAGDVVFMDIPQIGESQNKACGDEVNKEDGGLYIIADLCHYITAKETYTKLNLIRDSFGRDGNPTKGKTN
tara:strand:+ start:1593 stop:3059 length:1467 start_codon:yes stop_codon:yes gene_type:complete